MAKSLVVAKSDSPKNLGAAVGDARKKVAGLGIPMTVKPAELAKIEPQLLKTKKAEIKLSADYKAATLTLECGSYSTELGKHDLTKMGMADRIKVYEVLIKNSVLDKGPMDKVNTLKKRRDIFSGFRKVDSIIKAKAWPDLYKFAGTIYVTENLDFYVAVAKKQDRQEIIDRFIGPKSTDQINISDILADRIIDEGADPKIALEEVETMIENDIIMKYKVARIKEIDDSIEEILS